MMVGQAQSRSVLMGLDNHMITDAVPVLLPGTIHPQAAHDIVMHEAGKPGSPPSCNDPPPHLPAPLIGRRRPG